MAEKSREITEGFARDKSSLVPILQKVQEAEKSLTPEAIRKISLFLDMSENAVYSVASFYTQFHFGPVSGD
jgi:NADH-quinone oxidoreductase subunit E